MSDSQLSVSAETPTTKSGRRRGSTLGSSDSQPDLQRISQLALPPVSPRSRSASLSDEGTPPLSPRSQDISKAAAAAGTPTIKKRSGLPFPPSLKGALTSFTSSSKPPASPTKTPSPKGELTIFPLSPGEDYGQILARLAGVKAVKMPVREGRCILHQLCRAGEASYVGALVALNNQPNLMADDRSPLDAVLEGWLSKSDRQPRLTVIAQNLKGNGGYFTLGGDYLNEVIASGDLALLSRALTELDCPIRLSPARFQLILETLNLELIEAVLPRISNKDQLRDSCSSLLLRHASPNNRSRMVAIMSLFFRHFSDAANHKDPVTRQTPVEFLQKRGAWDLLQALLGYYEVFDAVEVGNVDALRIIMDNPDRRCLVNFARPNGETPVYVAIRKALAKVKSNAGINRRMAGLPQDQKEALADEKRRFDCVKLLLREANLNVRTVKDDTAYLQLILEGKKTLWEEVRTAIELTRVVPPLAFLLDAIEVGDLDAVSRLVVDRGIDLRVGDEDGKTAFMHACKKLQPGESAHTRIQILQLIAMVAPDVIVTADRFGYSGWTVLEETLSLFDLKGEVKTEAERKTKEVGTQLKAVVDQYNELGSASSSQKVAPADRSMGVFNYYGFSPTYYSTTRGYRPNLSACNPSDLVQPDVRNRNLLWHLVLTYNPRNKDSEAIFELIRLGLRVDSRDIHLCSIFHVAAAISEPLKDRLLVCAGRQGVDPTNWRDGKGNTFIDIEAVRTIAPRSLPIPAQGDLDAMFRLDDLPALLDWLKKGGNALERPASGRSILLEAVDRRAFGCAALLANLFPELVTRVDDMGDPPKELAFSRKDFTMQNFLDSLSGPIEGASMHASELHAYTMELHAAIEESNWVDVSALLESKGVELSRSVMGCTMGQYQNTPLLAALERQAPADIVLKMVELGANVKRPNSRGVAAVQFIGTPKCTTEVWVALAVAALASDITNDPASQREMRKQLSSLKFDEG